MSKLKRELNINNLKYFLQNIYPNKIDISNFNNDTNRLNNIEHFIINILDFFYDDIEIKKINTIGKNDETTYLDVRFYHKHLINKNYKKICLDNVSKISFYSLYPYIIINLIKKDLLKTNIPEFIIIYEFILKYYKGIQINNNIKILLKTVINYFFKLLYSNKYYIKVDNYKLIINYIDDFYFNLLEKYKDKYLFNDIDELFILNCNDDIINYINNFNVPFDIDENILIVYYYANKYILSYSNSQIERKGIMLTKTYLNKVNLFKNIRRKNKIEKIINKKNKKYIDIS